MSIICSLNLAKHFLVKWKLVYKHHQNFSRFILWNFFFQIWKHNDIWEDLQLHLKPEQIGPWLQNIFWNNFWFIRKHVALSISHHFSLSNCTTNMTDFSICYFLILEMTYFCELMYSMNQSFHHPHYQCFANWCWKSCLSTSCDHQEHVYICVLTPF